VALDFGSDHPKWIKAVSPGMLKSLADQFPAGSMGPKVESVVDFVESSSGQGWAAIGSLKEADKVMAGEAGTLIQDRDGTDFIEFYAEEVEIMKAA
jgi:carbamate kinase